MLDIGNLSKNNEVFSDKNKNVFEIFKIETPKNIWIDEFICRRSKKYVFKCGDDSEDKLKGICKSQSKNIKFEEYMKTLDGGEYRKESDNCSISSPNRVVLLQGIQTFTLSPFDDKRCYEINIKIKPWNYY